LHGIEGT